MGKTSSGHAKMVAVGCLLIGLGGGLLLGHLSKRTTEIPTHAQVAAAPHPTVSLPPDPLPTETGPQTVIEDEPAPLPPPPVAVAPPPPPPPAVAKESPAWKRYALPAPETAGRPMIAVIIDDMGLDKRRSERILALPGPLTISFMSYAEELPRQTAEAQAHGHEMMMHVPMEPLAEGLDPGPGALLDALPADELKRRIGDDLDRFKGYVGINNHMGSKFTAYAPGMTLVMEELHKRGLLFIDSLTTEHSVGLELARQNNVPAAGRNVFIDNDNDVAAVTAQLAKLEELARRKGNAIAIGHPRDATIAALTAWLPTLAGKGIVLVPVSAVVKARQPPH
jgi:hypothetical protein